jgi:hypothetical protein
VGTLGARSLEQPPLIPEALSFAVRGKLVGSSPIQE